MGLGNRIKIAGLQMFVTGAIGFMGSPFLEPLRNDSVRLYEARLATVRSLETLAPYVESGMTVLSKTESGEVHRVGGSVEERFKFYSELERQRKELHTLYKTPEVHSYYGRKDFKQLCERASYLLLSLGTLVTLGGLVETLHSRRKSRIIQNQQ